jgi:hypothetical protein
MMGFLQERAALAAQGAALGPAHLFFGCRSSAEDYIYRQELEGYLASGVLAGLHVAFSREGASKVGRTDASCSSCGSLCTHRGVHRACVTSHLV